MKKLIYMGMCLALFLSAAVWTGCDKPNELDPDSGGGSGGGTSEEVYGSIKGVVTEKGTGTLISMATVELLPTDIKTQTDAEGAFSFADLKQGAYQLCVSKDGYETYTGAELSVTDRRTLVLSIALSPKENTGPGTDSEQDYEETAFGMKLQMVAVEGGTFSMGATAEQGDDAYDWEKPVHGVTLDGFYIGAYEVTQSQWVAVMESTVAQQRDKAAEYWGEDPLTVGLYGVGDNYPMYYVSWEEAQSFCEKLSQKTGKTYRLPTEAEWEYAARGGNEVDGTKYAGSNAISDVAWYYDNSYGLGSSHPDYGTHPVGQKNPNALGLYDMSGNVWEWCQDWFGDYSSSSAVNPQGPSGGSDRVNRGGSWYGHAQYSRVSGRNNLTPGNRSFSLGFRIVCER
ncbi:MAG: SUMF1/EgtB/PvdO family nonheme iron enzyme [Bacteroidales bacterium]|nr:SUMF1/EgtB/PvdO family nonheme iron enzyme [Bacteroidales bacterium]